MNPKIAEHHRSKPAYIYLRQSTPGQVRHHQESTQRQYALRELALELGWSESLIRTLDRDLGKSGTEMAGREDFKTLVADVSMGQVGAVFALEVSRLARSNLDWHRLLELCALTTTLVIDEDGCYDPADFNDGLLLGLKGTMAQAELHFLHARLQGGKLNKAKKGELRFPLPVGFCYDDASRIILDPDEEVRGAVGLVFRLFHETGTAFAVMQSFAASGLRFPKRSYGGAWDGKIIWGRLTHSRVLGMLKNPSYAGMYVFGRYQYRREISPEGRVHKRMHAVAMPDWRVRLKEHHQGYITLEEFLQNQERLEKNRTNGEEMVLAGPAREGLALLQGLLLCGNCGRALSVRYLGNGGIYPCYQCNWLPREGLASKACMSFRCDLLDAAIAEEVLKALQPAELELALAALQELESRDQTLLRQWQMRLERAQYEAALAERRYQEVDPSQRLVAGTLERRWNDALLQLDEIKQQAAEFQRQEARVATPEQKAKVLALARDLPRLWHAPTTQAKDRKRMLRLLLKDITVEKLAEPKQLLVHIRWQGGACTDLSLQLPPNIADRLRYPAAVIERVRELAQGLRDAQIAPQLNREGHSSATGKPYTAKIIHWIRWRYQIPPAMLKKPEELTVQQVAQRFAVSLSVVYYWIEHRVIPARQLSSGMQYWITLSENDEQKLQDWVRNSGRIRSGHTSLTAIGGSAS
ncbi:MAG TPA: recombinase family protein [Candidatus Limnocylindrales bacterium]|jgi:DNA invertase Pin-like site-specific DNA recombinase|nr:recombinase family protein [Candidatus Limnocylindrales bacterium]